MYRIEFMGIPGVGKTTLQRQLIAENNKKYHNKLITSEKAFFYISKKKIEKIYRIILRMVPDTIGLKISNKLINRSLMQYEALNRFLAKWGKSIAAFLESDEYNCMDIKDREVVIGGIIQIAGLYECIDNLEQKDSYVIFEEGFLQKSLMFISKEKRLTNNKKHLMKYLENIPLPDLVVYIETDLQECYERMISRKQGLTNRLKEAKKEEIYNFLQQAEQHFENVIEWLNKKASCKIIKLDNNKNISDSILMLKNNISKLLQ